MDGVALQLARRGKEARYPELSGSHGRARLVVIAGEVGGRWSRETQVFLQSLAHCKAQGAPRSHPSGERRGGVVQEVVQFAGVFGGQSGCSLAVGEVGQPRCGWPVAFSSGGVGRRAA